MKKIKYISMVMASFALSLVVTASQATEARSITYLLPAPPNFTRLCALDIGQATWVL